MSARKCFTAKIVAGKVSRAAGTQILDMLEQFEKQHQGRLGDGAGIRQAALDAAAIARGEASRRANEVRGSLIAQANVLRAFNNYDQAVAALRKSPGVFGFGNRAPPTLGKEGKTTLGFALRSLLARDPFEIATWSNVASVARQLRGDAHRLFADAIETLRPKGLGFKPETARELDVLRALYGEKAEGPAAAAAKAWSEKVAPMLADEYIAAGGALAKRENWRLPNPTIDETKVRALGAERVKALIREHVDRADMPDYATGKPMTDARFEQVLNDIVNDAIAGFIEGQPSGAFKGRRMLANSRDFSRVFSWKSAESWMAIAEAIGTHSSPYEAMMGHISSMANDTAMMRILGPNPEATKRFALDLLEREAGRLAIAAAGTGKGELAKATKANRGVASRIRDRSTRAPGGCRASTPSGGGCGLPRAGRSQRGCRIGRAGAACRDRDRPDDLREADTPICETAGAGAGEGVLAASTPFAIWLAAPRHRDRAAARSRCRATHHSARPDRSSRAA